MGCDASAVGAAFPSPFLRRSPQRFFADSRMLPALAAEMIRRRSQAVAVLGVRPTVPIVSATTLHGQRVICGLGSPGLGVCVKRGWGGLGEVEGAPHASGAAGATEGRSAQQVLGRAQERVRAVDGARDSAGVDGR